ncbi:cytochrome P450 10-like [Physella acuta]|uniref:cytochrome P450 10-like n=1 Tax=Physella acuta TaxID=109671 RepID=UPI0027DD6507|nr:cytochrome P450 10-like [Physella acuta]
MSTMAVRHDVTLMMSKILKVQPVRLMSAVSSATTDQMKVKPFEEIPGPGGVYRWPVVGTLLHFKPFTKYTPETLHKLNDSLFDKYGPVVRVRLGEDMVMICDLKDIDTIYRHEGKYPNRPTMDVTGEIFAKNGFKKGLAELQGKEWHALRTPVNKRLMKADSAYHYLVPQNAVADDFVNILATQKLTPEEMKDLFFWFATESIAVVTFNTRLGYLDGSADADAKAFIEALKTIFVHINKSLTGDFAYKWYGSKKFKDAERCVLVVRENTLKHTMKAQRTIDEQKRNGTLNPDEPNLLHYLASDSSLTTEDIVNILFALYMAGTDSTAKNLQAFFYNLAKHPEKQEILRKEILNTVGKNGVVDAQALSKLSYLKHCLKESFRLNYPTVIGTVRILPTDVVLGGYNVPAGTQILCCNPRSAKAYFKDADKYLPERWIRSEECPVDNSNSMAVIPFSHGPRNCIGRRFAVQEIYLAAAKVLQKLKIELEPESWNTEFIYTTFIDTKTPLRFKFSKLD